MRREALALVFTLAAACGSPTADDDGGDDGGPSGPVVTEELGDDVYETVLDATDEAAWIYFDFEARAQAEPADPTDDATWDLGALRFNVKSNGGSSGSGGAKVAILEGEGFDAVTTAPADGWIEDVAEAPGMGGDAMAETAPGYAFDEWYAYDPMSHTLSPVADRVYVVRTPEGNHFKLEMLAYYDDAGTPGFVRFRWAAIPAA
jgi:hypothetical protein